MPVPTIDPIQTWHRVISSLIGRIFLFFSAGWFGLAVARFAIEVGKLKSLIDPSELLENLFDTTWYMEFLIMVLWPAGIAIMTAKESLWLFFPSMLVIGVLFVVFIFSEEPIPAWWLGLAGYIAIIHVAASSRATPLSWTVLCFILAGMAYGGWKALQIWHPELADWMVERFKGDDEE